MTDSEKLLFSIDFAEQISNATGIYVSEYDVLRAVQPKLQDIPLNIECFVVKNVNEYSTKPTKVANSHHAKYGNRFLANIGKIKTRK